MIEYFIGLIIGLVFGVFWTHRYHEFKRKQEVRKHIEELTSETNFPD